MDFFKSKAGIVVAVICLGVIAAVIWFTLVSSGQESSPRGTLVLHPHPWVCVEEAA